MRRTALMMIVLAWVGGCADTPRSGRRESVSRPPASTDQRLCHARLGAAGAAFTPLPDQYFGAGCATVGTIRLASVRSDSANLGLTHLGPVACPLAATVAAWARYGADRAALQILGSPLIAIETMGSYSCRTIAGTGRLSAHALAQAIDVSGFVLADGRRITVLGQWWAGSEPEQRFLRTVHASACKRFGTVLGPDYNGAHRDHLHLEFTGRSFCR
ncbi:MAG: extensin family protein [Novosphingobium sp.]